MYRRRGVDATLWSDPPPLILHVAASLGFLMVAVLLWQAGLLLRGQG